MLPLILCILSAAEEAQCEQMERRLRPRAGDGNWRHIGLLFPSLQLYTEYIEFDENHQSENRKDTYP